MVKGSDLGGADLYQLLKTMRPKDSQHPSRVLSWVSIVSRHCLINTQLSWLLWDKKLKELLKLTFFVSILNRLGLFNLKHFISGLFKAKICRLGSGAPWALVQKSPWQEAVLVLFESFARSGIVHQFGFSCSKDAQVAQTAQCRGCLSSLHWHKPGCQVR